jgi:hypothetical protein
MKEIIEKILRAAVMAPSGDNAQPWRFEVRGQEIAVINIPSKDDSLYNFNQQASFVAHGALIENIKIAAAVEGFSCAIELFPEISGQKDAVARIYLNKMEHAQYRNDLFASIPHRASNRKKYEDKQLSVEVLEIFKKSADDMNCGSLRIVSDKEKIKTIAHAVSMNEKAVLETEEMHHFLFKHVTWTPKEDAERHGFYLKTFEFKPPQEFIFKLFSKWNVMKFFNRFGAAKMIAKENEDIFASSAAFAAILVSETSRESYVKCGMLMQRIWLEATKEGISLQPTTGVIFLNHLIDVEPKEANKISNENKHIITDAYINLEHAFEAQNDTIAMIFRLGFAEAPSGRTTRFEPDITFIS